MVASNKKPGRPQETAGKINASILLHDDTDFLDAFDPNSPLRASPPRPSAEPTQLRQSVPEAQLVPLRTPEREHERSQDQDDGRIVRKAKKPGPEPAARGLERKKKQRPPRADIGYRPELESAASKLRKEAVTQSAEPSLNRTDVVSAATCAVARALGSINYSRIAPRGHYGTQTARQLHEELEEAYVVALGEHYIDRYRNRISDRALRLCYELYKQRMEGNESDDELPRSKA